MDFPSLTFGEATGLALIALAVVAMFIAGRKPYQTDALGKWVDRRLRPLRFLHNSRRHP